MTHSIEADWIINSRCNLHCEYCLSADAREDRHVGRFPIERIAAFFDETGRSWRLHITGGEPLLHPRFAELCALLSLRHLISLNTNLVSDTIYDLMDMVDPRRVIGLNCSAHIIERERMGLVDDYIRKLNDLADRGFLAYASQVMLPEGFPRFPADFEQLRARGVILIPKILRGVYRGQRYPGAYTARERELYTTYSLGAEDAGAYGADKTALMPMLDANMDRQFLIGIPDFKGVNCDAGRDFVRIRPNGDIQRCGGNALLGNVFRSKLRLLDAPLPCNDSCCPYYCAKYSHLSGNRAEQLTHAH